MQPNLAQVLNTVAHEIRTPLAVSQGYLKLYLDGRLTTLTTARALEQTREALGVLATLCVDMGMVSTLSEAPAPGVPERVAAADFVGEPAGGQSEVEGAAWQRRRRAARRRSDQQRANDLVHAVAIVAKAAFDEAREAPRPCASSAGDALVVLAGANDSVAALQSGPGAPKARPVDFAKGGKGLKLIWASFVLDNIACKRGHHEDHRASVGFRFPLVQA